MSQQIICDVCGEPIDQTITYYTAMVQPLQMVDGLLIGGTTEQRDYHTEHLPTGHLKEVADGAV